MRLLSNFVSFCAIRYFEPFVWMRAKSGTLKTLQIFSQTHLQIAAWLYERKWQFKINPNKVKQL